MENFVEILKDLILRTNLTLRQLEKESSVSATQYSRYLNGSIPTIEICLKIAKYFNCSLDYLFGLDENKNTRKYKTYDYDITKFLSNYQKLLMKNKISNFKFMKDSDFNENIYRHWQNGSTPRMDVIFYIAKNLNGSIDELIGRY